MGTKEDRIEQLREILGVNKAKMAEYMGVSASYYGHILSQNRRGNLRLEHLDSLLNNVNVNPLWIMTGEGEMFLNISQVDWEREPNDEEVNALYKFVLERYPTELSYLEQLKFRLACAQCYYDNPKIKSLDVLAMAARVYLRFIKAMPNLDLPGVLGG